MFGFGASMSDHRRSLSIPELPTSIVLAVFPFAVKRKKEPGADAGQFAQTSMIE
jgi:hypothetical protein